MKTIRLILSGRLTLVFIAFLCGVYLFETFGNKDPFEGMLRLFRENPLARIFIFIFCIHLFVKGIHVFLKDKKRYFASAIFFISLSLVISGIFFSVLYRQKDTKRYSVSGKTEGGLHISDIRMDMPENLIMTGRDSDFRIRDVSAVVEDGGKSKVLKPYPLTRTSSGYAYINDAGISPSCEILISSLVKPHTSPSPSSPPLDPVRVAISNGVKGGEILEPSPLAGEGEGEGVLIMNSSANMDGNITVLSKLDIFPLNKVIPLLPDYSIELSLLPEKEIKKGRLIAKQYNLIKPEYRALLKKGGLTLIDATLADKQALRKDDVSITCGPAEEWIEIIFVKDNAVAVIYCGIFGLFASILLFPFQLIKNLMIRQA